MLIHKEDSLPGMLRFHLIQEPTSGIELCRCLPTEEVHSKGWGGCDENGNCDHLSHISMRFLFLDEETELAFIGDKKIVVEDGIRRCYAILGIAHVPS